MARLADEQIAPLTECPNFEDRFPREQWQPMGALGLQGITACPIEKGDEGFSIGQKISKVGTRGPPTAELVFNDCFVPEDRIMGPLNGGVGVLGERARLRARGALRIAARHHAGLPRHSHPLPA